jgi:hypothetical protein
MLESWLELIRDMVDALQNTHRKLAEAVSDFLEALLEFINAAYIWLSEAATAIWNYLTTLFTQLIELGFALLKVSLFYIPSIAMFTIYISGNSVLWLFLAIIWFVLITSIALFYKKRW